jgi:glycosyltransferase involved in cell wall biosynthesis
MAQKSIAGFTTTYNCFQMHYPFLECIKSLLGFCDEISIVDAGSTDGTIEALSKLQKSELRIKFSVEPVDFTHPRWAIYQDGYLKAKAREKCTADYCWQTDTDEIVAEHDYQKVRDLPDIIGTTPLIMLPMIEFWGSLKTIRSDFFSWKPRFSINDKRITHGIPKDLRCYDSLGHEYPRPFDSDSCNYIYKDTLEGVKIVVPVETATLENVNLGTPEYEKLFYSWLDTYPAVFHVSWLDLRRKVQHYKKLWRHFHGSMYNLNIEDNASNNVMFDKPWSDVSELDIKEKSEELKKLGPRFFHKKMDTVRKGHVIEFNRPVPESLESWYAKELQIYAEEDRKLHIEASIKEPLVSAVVPSLRETKFLTEAIECLAKQDYSNIEILVVNEGNLDEVDEAVLKLKAKFPEREIMIINKNQSGLSEAKNFGIRQARGTYVMVLEAEDLISGNYISKGVNILRSSNSNLFYSNVEIAGDKKGEIIPENFDPYFLRYNNSIPKSALFSRSLWHRAGGYKAALPFGEEWDFWLNCTNAGIKPVHAPEKLYTDRVYPAYDNSLQGEHAEQIKASVVIVANQDLYPVDEVIAAQECLVKNSAEWLWRCQPLEKSRPEDWLLRLLLALGYEGRGQVQDSMSNLGASIQFSSYKNWQPLYRLGTILEKNNQHKEAAEFFHSVRSLRPDMAKIVNKSV